MARKTPGIKQNTVVKLKKIVTLCTMNRDMLILSEQ